MFFLVFDASPAQPVRSVARSVRSARPVRSVVQPDPFVWSGRSGCLITVIRLTMVRPVVRPAGPVSWSRSVPVPGALDIDDTKYEPFWYSNCCISTVGTLDVRVVFMLSYLDIVSFNFSLMLKGVNRSVVVLFDFNSH